MRASADRAALTGAQDTAAAADPILVHPDIRRILMSIRSFNEAARALLLWTALKGDVARRSEDERDRMAADDRMGLLTPVLKGILTDKGFENAVAAQQVFGGHGYIAEHGMEQFVRDARIAMIYEGANGIQALDLVGRKLPKDGGRAVMTFFAEVGAFLKENERNEALGPFVAPLKAGLDDLQQATMWFMQNAMKKPDNAGAGATDYMHLFGLVALGFMWALMAKASAEKLANGAGGREKFYEARLTLGKFFMERAMPETAAHLARISAGADTLMAMPAEMF
jgi:acyl-CoA dehydrogenase